MDFFSYVTKTLVTFIFIYISPHLFAEVTVNSLFNDHMVLQQKKRIPIWGKGTVNEHVTVSLLKENILIAFVETTVDKNGEWRIVFNELSAGGPFTLFIQGQNSIEISDVLVGEVWLCSGQSNMEYTLETVSNGIGEIKSANYPLIRAITVPRLSTNVPQKEINALWSVCSPETAATYSGVGYLFGRELFKSLNVPIGLIFSAYGATRAEAWTKYETLKEDSILNETIVSWEKAVQNYPNAYKNYMHAMALYKSNSLLNPSKSKQTLPPEPPVGPGHRNSPAGLYNGMIAPLAPFGIAGIAWYHGTANVPNAEQYRNLLTKMIADWREVWGSPIPFGIVQIANHLERDPVPVDSKKARLREAQLLVSKTVSNCGLVVTIDIGEANDVHPKNKQETGRRLGYWARSALYNEKILSQGPVFEKMEISGNKIILTFSSVGKGLQVKKGEVLKGFAICDVRQKFVWANAKIVGKTTVEVSAKEIKKPIAVRYGWSDNPEANLYNDLLPASPFRTDNY